MVTVTIVLIIIFLIFAVCIIFITNLFNFGLEATFLDCLTMCVIHTMHADKHLVDVVGLKAFVFIFAVHEVTVVLLAVSYTGPIVVVVFVTAVGIFELFVEIAKVVTHMTSTGVHLTTAAVCLSQPIFETVKNTIDVNLTAAAAHLSNLVVDIIVTGVILTAVDFCLSN